jgi:hypothetical protein
MFEWLQFIEEDRRCCLSESEPEEARLSAGTAGNFWKFNGPLIKGVMHK